MRSLEWLLDMITNVVSKFVTFLLAFYLATTFVDVVMRSVFQYPILWLQEITLICFIWTVFLGAAIGVSNNAHFTVDLLPHLGKLDKVHKIFVQICTLLFGIFLLVEGYNLMIMGLNRFSRPSGIPMFYIFMTLPASGAMMVLYTIKNLFKLISGSSLESLEHEQA